jgi:uncharacterized protein
VIVLDTTVLAYAVGLDHPFRDPARRLIEAVTAGRLRATTTVEVIQEFAHIGSRRRDRATAAELARRYHRLLSPLLIPDETALEHGLQLFERHPLLGSFDAVLAAAAISVDAEALVSTDGGFSGIRRLRHVDPSTPALDELIP